MKSLIKKSQRNVAVYSARVPGAPQSTFSKIDLIPFALLISVSAGNSGRSELRNAVKLIYAKWF